MLFPTFQFAVFFLVCFGLSWSLAGRPRSRKLFLVVASYLFYGVWSWRLCFLLLGSSLFNYAMGRAVFAGRTPHARKIRVAFAVAGNLAVLGTFKYFDFFASSFNGLLFGFGLGEPLPLLDILLPIGVSFFTFHGISYVVDLYRQQLEKPAGLVDMLLYISFFPQLVAGPIVRAAHFLPQLTRPVDPNDIRATRAFLLIASGLFKKVVLANYLATQLVDGVFFDPAVHGAGDLLIAIYGYAFQIYCDFSAYTDIATGVAALLGYRFPKNFDQPYRAASLQDFWRRWHISLSSWLRDYLYIPLGGNRGGRWRTAANLFLTMLLGGLWHGAAWNFVIWGTLHGAALVAERLLGPGERRPGQVRNRIAGVAWARVVGTALVFHFLCLTWVFFRAPDLAHALSYLAGFARWGAPVTVATPLVLVLLAAGVATQTVPGDWLGRVERIWCRFPFAAQGVAFGAAIAITVALGPTGVAPFIYFQF